MAAASKPEETGVALVTSPAVGTLPASVQHQLELRKLSNQVAGKIGEMNWGNKLDLATRRAIADWGRTYGVDPATEVHVLGGNIYLNAAYYLRRLAQLIERGVVEYAYADHIEHDDRLDALGAEGVGEKNRRLRERIMHQVDEKAKSAVVFRVKLKAMTREIVGVKWCGNGTQKGDPVGDAKPVETSESRAARRAMRQIITHLPEEAQEITVVEDAADMLSESIVASEQAFDAASTPSRAPRPFARVDPLDPYKTLPGNGPSAYVHPSQADQEPFDREPGDEEDSEFTPPF